MVSITVFLLGFKFYSSIKRAKHLQKKKFGTVFYPWCAVSTLYQYESLAPQNMSRITVNLQMSIKRAQHLQKNTIWYPFFYPWCVGSTLYQYQ